MFNKKANRKKSFQTDKVTKNKKIDDQKTLQNYT